MIMAWQYHETFQPYDSLDVVKPVRLGPYLEPISY